MPTEPAHTTNNAQNTTANSRPIDTGLLSAGSRVASVDDDTNRGA